MILSKTVEDKDYELMKEEFETLKSCGEILKEHGVRWDIAHHHRYWEYAMAMKAAEEWAIGKNFKGIKIGDVGAGLGLLGPTIAFSYSFLAKSLEEGGEISYVEIEQIRQLYPEKVKLNEFLKKNGRPEITWVCIALEDVKHQQLFDIVYCISVIEHTSNDAVFLVRLANLVKPGGLLFLTTDIMPFMPGHYTMDNLRTHNYTMCDLTQMANRLIEHGFEYFGEVDGGFHGAQVFDYTFGSLCMVKK